MRITTLTRLRVRAAEQDGFSIIVAIAVMLVTGLLLVGAFTAADGEIQNSHKNSLQTQAYYAALAGVQEYVYKLQDNPDYWQTCAVPVDEESGQHYEVKLLPAHSAPTGTKECQTSSPFTSMIESTGTLANTFRIEVTGCAGANVSASCVSTASTQGQKDEFTANVATRKLVATFQVTGFLDYVFFTKYELIDPSLYSHPHAACEEYYAEGSKKRSSECETLIFAENDSVHGPMHTDDAANVTCSNKVTFGREGQNPPDRVEMNGGTWPECGGSGPKYNTASGKPEKGEELNPPESDTSLEAYVEHEPQENEFTGRTELTLNGETGTISASYYKEEPNGTLVAATRTLTWPKNGLIYVQGNSNVGCDYTYSNNEEAKADNTTESNDEKGCGTVYVHGTYSQSLTIAAEDELVVNKNLTPYGVTPPAAPTGTATLGLIATKFVRLYHPTTSCTGASSGTNQTGSLSNPWIYAAILSTSHSFIVDNFECGAQLGTLGVYGAIAQKFRGAVGTVNNSGYLKEYKYDERLATDEPPYFLAPLKSGWRVIRETAPTNE